MPCDDEAYAYNASANCGPPTVCKQVMSWTADAQQCIGVPAPTNCAVPKLGGMAGEGCSLVLQVRLRAVPLCNLIGRDLTGFLCLVCSVPPGKLLRESASQTGASRPQ